MSKFCKRAHNECNRLHYFVKKTYQVLQDIEKSLIFAKKSKKFHLVKN